MPEETGAQEVTTDDARSELKPDTTAAEIEMEAAREKIAKLEEAVAEHAQAHNSAMKRVSESEQKLAIAVAKYRIAVLRGEPHLPEELVQGETIDEIDRTAMNARNVVQKVRAQTQREIHAASPVLPPEVMSKLSPQDKIRIGLMRQ